MPLYEYKCPKCNQKFEELRPISRATEDTPCPVCKSPAKRIMSTFAAVSRDSGGMSSSIAGGSSCSSCGSTASCTSG